MPMWGRSRLDGQALDALKAGDEQAWDDFFRLHDALIRNVVSWPKWFFSTVVRQDVAQKIRTDLTKSIHSFSGKSSLEHFIKTISVRRCIDEVRRQVREKQTFVPGAFQDTDGEWHEIEARADESYDPVRDIVLAERARYLRQLLGTLREACRVAVREFYLDEMSYREMAEKHGISINTVGSRLAKCLARLREKMRQNPELREDLA